METSITLTEFVRKIAELDKLTAFDLVTIERYYNKNQDAYTINVIPGYLRLSASKNELMGNALTVFVQKNTSMVFLIHGVSLTTHSPEVITYVDQIKTTGTRIVDNMTEFVPTNYNDRLNKNTIIEYIRYYVDGNECIRIHNPASAINNKSVIEVTYDKPFEKLIYSKPMENAEACKKIARRLVGDGFHYITPKTSFMVNNHVMDRYYKYRDIHICFYRDSVIYVGLSSTNQFPKEWTAFKNITEDILDTEIHQFLVDNWYNPNN